MQFSATFFQSIYLAVTLASAVSAAPFTGSVKLRSFQTRATFGVDGVDHPLSKRDNFDIRDATVSFIESKTGFKADGVNFRTSFSSDVTQHAYVRQQINGIPVANAVANIAFNGDNKVVSFGHSFVKAPSAKSIPKTEPTLSVQDAISKAESALACKYNSHPTTLEWVAKKDGSLALAHVVQVQNDEKHEWFEAFVDAHTGDVIQLTDFVAKASYRVLPISKQKLTEGFETLRDPANLHASPKGWNYNGTATTTDTSGNNAVAFKNDESGTAKQSSSGQNFVFTQDPAAAPTTKNNLAAAITNGFYIVNTVHDISYLYGFTEKAYNFQNDNFGKGGTGGDRVRVSIQNTQGVDNAYFSTPPDGQPGQMAMFLWDAAHPERDGALENDVPVHENTHGISNRMTGGGTARCLQTDESAGMGEGWSDAMAEWTEQKDAKVRDFVVGPYVTNNPAGIRSYPYSTNARTNPLRYSSVKTRTEVHVALAATRSGSTSSSTRSPSSPATPPHRTMQVRAIGAKTAIESFHPESLFETFGVEGLDDPLSARDEFSLADAALSFVQSRLDVAPDAAAYRDGYTNDVVQHAFIQQQISGIPVANAVANVVFNKANRVVSFGSSFVQPFGVPSSTPSISVTDAIAKAESELGGAYNGHPTKLEFVAQEDSAVALTHVVQVRDDSQAMWYEAFVDAHTGDIVQLTDFGAHASYRVLPITEQNVTQGFQTLTNPQNTASSPLGWHNNGGTRTNDTSGNNVITFVITGATRVTTPESSAPLNFVYIQDPTKDPKTWQPNVHAARVNAFYIVNTVHDISYRYGFTEAAFNFQTDNFGKGGRGNDRVEVSVQDPGGFDNGGRASLTVTPSGQSGYMRMYLWDKSVPMRDGSLENDVVVHENTHGITNRMTGGGTGRCLQTLEAKGLGEGWSDAFAEWTEWTNATVTDWILASYVGNRPGGLRTHPYSTSPTTNPLRYSNLRTLNEEHYIGEVWANMLHNVYAALVARHGFSATAKTDPATTGGNTVFLHLFMDALALQPCNPTFPQARAAWIQADANRYHGANNCTLWRQFASRGLGVGAANHIDSTVVPSGC
ncbi:hypothetical protein V8D89_004766 [Ganoderma adspersum]